MFKTNNKSTMNTLMAPGEYELIILSAHGDVTPGGAEYFSIQSVVRNDVDQRYQNKRVFDSLWLSEKALPYSEHKMNIINKVLDLPEAEYDGYDDWGALLRGKAIRAKIGHSKPQSGYEAREQVQSYMGTRAPDVKHVFVAPAESGRTEQPAEDEEELPF